MMKWGMDVEGSDVSYFKLYASIWLEGVRKSTKNLSVDIACARTRTRHLSNMRSQRIV
jgi:hypothetical protein